MAQPRALQDALKASDELIEQMKDTEEESADLDAQLKEALADQHREEDEAPPEPEPESEEAAAPDPELERLRAENARLEQAHKVLQGKYNAEVPRLSEEVRHLKEQLAQTPEPDQPDPDVEKVKSKLLDMYTEEEVEALTGLIQHYAKPKTDSSEIKALRDQLNQVTHQTREQQLTALVPDWQQLNASEAFIAYLKEINPESGQERNRHLQEAWGVGDIARAAAIFNNFKERLGKPTAPPPVEPEQKARAPKAPSVDRKVWRQSEIEQISKAFHNGYFRGREAEYRALRDRIELATVEGRVDPNR